jgi:hypothetical protein
MPSYVRVPDIIGEAKSPAPSEVVITKQLDSTSPLLFGDEVPTDSFAFGATGQTTGAYPAGSDIMMGDGSVRSLGSLTFGDFDLV